MRIMNVIKWLVASVAILFSATVAIAQHDDLTPFHPIDYEEDFQAFERFEPNMFGEPRVLHEGWFFGFERFVSFPNAPDKVPIGSPNLTAIVIAGNGFRIEQNTHDTGFLNSGTAWGNRYELGFVDERRGWLLGVYDGQPQDTIEMYEDVDVVFEDPPFGPFATGHLDGFVNIDPRFAGNPLIADNDLDGDGIFGRYFDGDLDGAINPGDPDDIIANPQDYDFDDLARMPVLYEDLIVRNKSYMDGVELMRLVLFKPFSNASALEFHYGVRFYKFRDRFNVFGMGGVLDESFWNTLADNHVVGPQVGLRWYARRGRWTVSTLARFLAGFNFFTLKQDGALGSTLSPVVPVQTLGRNANEPSFFDPISWNHARNDEEFSPSGEFRLDVSYNLTSEIALKAGWTGMFNQNIVRASNNVQYTLPTMGFYPETRDELLMIHHATFGFEWNR